MPKDWWQLSARGSASPSPAKGSADTAKQPQRKAKPVKCQQKTVKVQPAVADMLLAAAAQPLPAAAHFTASAPAPGAAEALAAAEAPAAAEVPLPAALLSSEAHAAGLEEIDSRPTSAASKHQPGVKRGRPSSGGKGGKGPGKKPKSSVSKARPGRRQSAKSHGAVVAELPALDDHQLLQVLQRLVAPAGATDLALAPPEASTVGHQHGATQHQQHQLVSRQAGLEPEASTVELVAAGLQEAPGASLGPQCMGWAPGVAAGRREDVQEQVSRLPHSHSIPAAGPGDMEVDTPCADAELMSPRLTVAAGLEAQPVSMHLTVGQPQPEAMPNATGYGAAGTELAPAAAAAPAAVAAAAAQAGGAAGQQQPVVAGKRPGGRGLGKGRKGLKRSPLRQKAGVGKKRSKTVTRLVMVADGLSVGEAIRQMRRSLFLQPQLHLSSGAFPCSHSSTSLPEPLSYVWLGPSVPAACLWEVKGPLDASRLLSATLCRACRCRVVGQGSGQPATLCRAAGQATGTGRAGAEHNPAAWAGVQPACAVDRLCLDTSSTSVRVACSWAHGVPQLGSSCLGVSGV